MDNSDICCIPHHSWCACSQGESKRSHSIDLASGKINAQRGKRNQPVVPWVHRTITKGHATAGRFQQTSFVPWHKMLQDSHQNVSKIIKILMLQDTTSTTSKHRGYHLPCKASTHDTGTCCSCHISSCNPPPIRQILLLGETHTHTPQKKQHKTSSREGAFCVAHSVSFTSAVTHDLRERPS